MNDPVSSTTPDDIASPESRKPFRGALLGSLLILLAAIALSAWAWQSLAPDARIPIHWNAKGQPDGYAGRMGVWYTVFGIVGIIAVFAFIPLLEPRRGHLLQSSRAYQAVWLASVGFFGLLHTVIVLTALGHSVSTNRWMNIGIGLLFVVIGNFLGKTRSNFIFGIRTPWTLSSELSWRRTHRLGGWIFLLFGLSMLALGIFDVSGKQLYYSQITGVIILIAVPVFYSYRVWKNDPDRSAS